MDQKNRIKEEPLLVNYQIEYFHLINEEVREINGNQVLPINEFSDTEVQVLAGIGNPEKLYSELKKKGLNVTPVITEDHGEIDLETIQNIKTIPLFITPKDYVKYQGRVEDNTWLLDPIIEIMEGSKIDSLLNEVIENKS